MFTRARAEETHCVIRGDWSILLERYLFLQDELDKLLQQSELMEGLLYSENLKNKGKFRDELQGLIQPYKQWQYPGRKAKNFRFLTEQVRSLLLSLHDRWVISEHCERHDWKFSTQLMDELHNAGLYPRYVEVKNICRAGKMPTIPSHKTLVMDWSTQDKENIRKHGNDFEIEVDHTWLTVEVPSVLHDKHKVSKPAFRLGADGILYCTFSYEEKEQTMCHPSGGVGANDWGKINQISCAAVYPDESWTRQYLGTREGDHLHEQEQDLTDRISHLCDKRDAIADLLKGRYDSHLYDKWCGLSHEIGKLRSARSRLREHMCHVDARDVVDGFMVEARVDELHLEDLSDMDDSTHLHTVGLTQDYIRERCEAHGFACVMVGFSQSSHTNPFTGEHVDPDEDRLVVVDEALELELDRDHCASLELCVRPAKRGKSGSRRKVGRPVIGKGDVGRSACRVRPVRVKGEHKRLVKGESSRYARRARKLHAREVRARLHSERDAFYERAGTRRTRQVFSGSGRCIAVTDTAWAKSPSGQLPTINNDNHLKYSNNATIPHSNAD